MEGTWKWKKSSYTQGADNCVEMAWGHQGLLTRDSKAPDDGTLVFTATSASAWLAAVKAGQFDF